MTGEGRGGGCVSRAVYGYPHFTLWCLEDKHGPKLLPSTSAQRKGFSSPPPPHSLCLQGGVSIERHWTDNPCGSPYSDQDLSVVKVTVRGFNLDNTTEIICLESFVMGHFLWIRSIRETLIQSSDTLKTLDLDCWLSLSG